MPYILCFKTDAFQNSPFKMHLAQLSSIHNTIQSNSAISSLNVRTTLCLSHSMPGVCKEVFQDTISLYIYICFLFQTAA